MAQEYYGQAQALPQQNLPWGRYRMPHMQWHTGIEYERFETTNPIPGQPLLVPINDDPIPSTSLWDIYNQKAALADNDLSLDFNSSMDVLLVFAGLFGSVNAAFIIETYKLLQPDQAELTNQLLSALLQNQSHSSIELSADFSPPAYAIRVNALLFASLICSLMTALAAMLVKQWVGYYDRGLRKISSRQIRARTRQYRYDGVQKWHMSDVVALVPMVLHLSLFLFFAGIVDFLFALNKTMAIISTTFVLAGFLLYLFANILPLISSGAPFRSPITQFLDNMAQNVRRRYISNSRQRLRTRSDEKAGDDAIEDPTDLWLSDDEPQARTVRLTRTLDVDAVAWLMLEADKTTERVLLDMCFEKLMSFRHIVLKDPSSFFLKEIAHTYRQMAVTCLYGLKEKSFIPNRVVRARLLCRFLGWYLNLPRNEEQTRWLRENIPFSEATMLRACAQYASEVEENETHVTARVAYRALYHLHSAKTASCDLCLGDMVLSDQFNRIRHEENGGWWMRTYGTYVEQDLTSITKCIFSHPMEDTARLDNALEQALSFIRADGDAANTFGSLKRLLDTGNPTYPMIATRWREALSAAISESVAKGPSDINQRVRRIPEDKLGPTIGYQPPYRRSFEYPEVTVSGQPAGYTTYPSNRDYYLSYQGPSSPTHSIARPNVRSGTTDHYYSPSLPVVPLPLQNTDQATVNDGTDRFAQSSPADDRLRPVLHNTSRTRHSGSRRRSGSS